MTEEPNDGSDEDLENKLRAELDEALLALDELAHQDPEEALSMFDSLPEPVQALPDFQLLLARAHQSLKQLDAARDLLHAILDKTPESADAHHLLGDVLEDLGESKTANGHFLKTRTLDAAVYAAVAPEDRKEFESALAEVARTLPTAATEIDTATIQQLPDEDAVLNGLDPRALVSAADRLVLYAANLFAEFSDLLGEEPLVEELRRAALLECADTWKWGDAKRSELRLGPDDERTEALDVN